MIVTRIPPLPRQARYALEIDHDEAADILYALQHQTRDNATRVDRMIDALGAVMRGDMDETDTA